mgnify:CR=1 FL=1
MDAELHVEALDAERVPDFYRLHCDRHDTGWCFCVAWWVPDWETFAERSAEENQAERQRLFDQGEFDGYMLYDGEEVVAWAQVGRRDRLEKLRDNFGLPPDPEVHALSCILVRPDRRGQGMARRLLQGILVRLRERGVKRLQAFPKSHDELDALEAWTGPRGLFVREGFRLIQQGEVRAVYECGL